MEKPRNLRNTVKYPSCNNCPSHLSLRAIALILNNSIMIWRDFNRRLTIINLVLDPFIYIKKMRSLFVETKSTLCIIEYYLDSVRRIQVFRKERIIYMIAVSSNRSVIVWLTDFLYIVYHIHQGVQINLSNMENFVLSVDL